MKIKSSLSLLLSLVFSLISLTSTNTFAGDASSIDTFLAKGIHFETADGNNSMTINPQTQLRYSYENREGSGNDAQSLLFRRVYLGFVGNLVSKDFTYNLTLNLIPGATASNVLYYAHFNYRLCDAFQIQSGLMKLPFNRQEMTSSFGGQFVEWSLANHRFNIGNSIAVNIHGTPFNKKMEYYLAVSNGRNTNALVNGNQEMAFIGRLVFNAMGEYGYSEADLSNSDKAALTFGLAGEWHKEEPTVSAAQNRIMTGAADVGFKYRGFSFQAEGFLQNADPTGGAAKVTNVGYYAQAGYFFIPKKFEFAVRASSLFDDITDKGGAVYFNNGSITRLGGVNDGVDVGADADNEHEFSGVLNYYIKGNNIKLQAQYTYMLDGVAGANDIANHILMAQLQAQF